MKKIVLLGLVSIFGFCPSAQSQGQKGSVYWGGTISFRANAQNEFETTTSADVEVIRNNSINPELQIGRFINNTTLIGVGAIYSVERSTSRQTTNVFQVTRTIRQSIQIAPFIRKYHALNDRWALFLYAEAGPIFYTSDTEGMGASGSTKYETRYWEHRLIVKPGLTFHFPRGNWAVEGYFDLLSLNFSYVPSANKNKGAFVVYSNMSTGFPRSFTLRLARYLTPLSNKL